MTTDVNHSRQSFLSMLPPLNVLALYPAAMPSPSAHIILSVARMLRQSSCEHVMIDTCGLSAVDEDTLMSGLDPLHPDATLWVKDELWSLTGESTPAGDVAGGSMGEDENLLGEAGGCDCVGEA